MIIYIKLRRTKITVALILLISALSTTGLHAQGEFNIWCFGIKSGLDFNGMAPKSIATNFEGLEGSSSVCDRYGKLLFYSNGEKVWNRKHEIMQNGDNLKGHISASQAALIVPKPGNNLEYYLFTVDIIGDGMKPNGIYYSIIDMTKSNGDGEVVKKNILLKNPSTERITAVRHSNEVDIWIVTHDWNSSIFRVFLLTHEGIIDTILSDCGDFHEVQDPTDIQGILKASPHGNRLAISMKGQYQVFDFDNSKGIISNPVTLRPWQIIDPYGVEFSPDGTKLYTTNFYYDGVSSKLYQFDLQAGSASAVNNSAILIYEYQAGRQFGAIQAGPDERIYVAKNNRDSLAIIEKPNLKGIACAYNDNFIKLNSTCLIGLPGYIQTTETKIDVTGTSPVCVNDTVYLTCSSIDAIKYEWEGPKGYNSSEQNPALYKVSADMAGRYSVKLTYKDGYIDSAHVDIIIKETIFDNINEISYEPLAIGAMDRKSIGFKNSSVFDIYIDTAYIKGNADSVFRFFGLPSFPLLVPAGETVTFTVDYFPLEPITYDDSIIVIINEPCKHSDAVGISARGLTKDLYLWLPDINAIIGQPNVCIPLKAVLECVDEIKYKAPYRVEIRYDYTIFKPYPGQKGISYNKDGGDCVITIDGDSLVFSGDTLLLANICGAVYLGYQDKTPLYITDFSWPDTLITLEKNKVHLTPGSITINTVCQSPIRRVKSFIKTSFYISPNPGNEFVDISADCRENGSYKLNIYNAQGRITETLIWDVKQDNQSDYDFKINLENYSSGIYMITITTPSEVLSRHFTVMK